MIPDNYRNLLHNLATHTTSTDGTNYAVLHETGQSFPIAGRGRTIDEALDNLADNLRALDVATNHDLKPVCQTCGHIGDRTFQIDADSNYIDALRGSYGRNVPDMACAACDLGDIRLVPARHLAAQPATA